MNSIKVIASADRAWPDLKDNPQLEWSKDALITFGRLLGGTESGASSIAMRFDLPNGRVVVIETSMNAFLAAASFMVGAEERTKEQLSGEPN